MKTILFATFALFLTFFAYSQTTIENPKVGMSTASNVKIVKIELSDAATILWVHVNSTPGNWMSVPNKTYIQPVGAKEKLYIVSAEGIPLDKQYIIPPSGEVDYKVIFPKIDDSVAKLDFGEGNDGGNWFIYDIQLKPELYQSILPEKISGNWFRSDNAQWEISLFDSVAIYKSQVWKYQQYSEKDGVGKIRIKSGNKTADLYAMPIDDNICMIGETPAKLVKYSSQPDESVVPADNEVFKSPVFKVDSITYCGYIKGFNPRFPQRTGMVYVNNVLTGDQESYVLKIEDDGTFRLKFAHSNPQMVMIRMPFSSESVFFEPGKTIFQLIDNGNKANPALFMGSNARLNSELLKLKAIDSFNYTDMTNKILDFTPEQYKDWGLSLLKKDLKTVSEYQQKYHLSAKAVQIKELMLKCRDFSNLFEYTSISESAYRSKNNVPNTQRIIPFKPAQPDSIYYNFLTSDWVNSQLPMLTSDYYFFINRLKYASIFTVVQKGISTAELISSLGKSGEPLTVEEKDFIKRVDSFSPQFESKQKEYQANYGKQSEEFYKINTEMLQPFFQEKKGTNISIAEVETYLASKKVEFSEKEKVFLEATKKFEKDPVVIKFRELDKEVSEFVKNHQSELNELVMDRRSVERNLIMNRLLGIPKGFASDVMTSQDYCRTIVTEKTPVSKEKLQFIQKKISDPFIANYISKKNQEVINFVDANKKLKGSIVNQVPKTEGDKLFNAIISKYKGKVIYVDFWATWCAPCLEGIKMIKPLKEEMANENVAFVYITGETSPKKTYDNMIPSIKGEHYRVSGDEWNFLCGKFGISGIPHYMLIGKDGNIINPNFGHLENEQLKSRLMKYIKE